MYSFIRVVENLVFLYGRETKSKKQKEIKKEKKKKRKKGKKKKRRKQVCWR